MVDLHAALAVLDNRPPGETTPAAIIQPAGENPQGPAAETLRMFCNLLGDLTGDISFLLMARGGVYLAGGILPRITVILVSSRFRERFERKWRGTRVVAGIPTYLVTHEFAALLGCAELMK
jgi:glucokinase